MNDLINARCGWAGTDELYVKYHDVEWGKPVDDDRILFEFLVLESAQAGLSWITILRKREGYRKAFHRFDPERVAQMTPEEVDRLMRFDGIVRNRLKITAAINNAKLFRAIQKEFGSFYEYVLSFFPGRQPIVNDFKSLSQIPATSPESDAMSRDMKKRGFKFFGSTICYAFLQATGFVNDHLTGCRLNCGRHQTATCALALLTTVTTAGNDPHVRGGRSSRRRRPRAFVSRPIRSADTVRCRTANGGTGSNRYSFRCRAARRGSIAANWCSWTSRF